MLARSAMPAYRLDWPYSGIVEHPINQLLECSRRRTALLPKFVDGYHATFPVAVTVFGFLLNMQSAIVILKQVPPGSSQLTRVVSE
jgi:hypothetical protein